MSRLAEPLHDARPAPSHLFFLLQGYAVLDGATMPVVGDPETANNTFVEQIVGQRRAAIDKAVEMGVTDRNRVGVGGHSYGAFMTANLLAHSDLFRAGIARSGAYNRTLTPFGFQSERRTLWEAPEMYAEDVAVHARPQDQGAAPADPRRGGQQPRHVPGAERAAVPGGPRQRRHVRYVLLPHESHGYAARESVEHTLHEMVEWFERAREAIDDANFDSIFTTVCHCRWPRTRR